MEPEIHFSRSSDFSYSKSSTGQNLDEWLETLKGLRQGPERVFVAVHFFSGERRDGDMEEWIGQLGEAAGLKVHVTSADLAEHPEWDFVSLRVCDRLMEAIELGLVDIIICGPPCSTWSAALTKIREYEDMGAQADRDLGERRHGEAAVPTTDRRKGVQRNIGTGGKRLEKVNENCRSV